MTDTIAIITSRAAVHAEAINAREIKTLRSSLGEDAEAIIGLFLKETADRLARMGKLGDRTQRDVLAREAHSLKSAAATFGCNGLAQLALALEEEASILDAATLPARLSVLSQAYEEARSALLD